MESNNPLIGSFYFGFKQELIKIVAQVNADFMLTEIYDGIAPVEKRMVALSKLANYTLYPSVDAAYGREIGGNR